MGVLDDILKNARSNAEYRQEAHDGLGVDVNASSSQGSNAEFDISSQEHTPISTNDISDKKQMDSGNSVTNEVPATRKPENLYDLTEMLRAPKQQSPEELQKEQKRERSKAIIAALSDGVSSIANLHDTTKGAVSTSQPEASLSVVNKQRYDAIIANRTKKQEEYIAALERAGIADITNRREEGLQKEKQEFEVKKDRMANQAKRKESERDRAYRAEQSAADRDAKQQSLTAQQQFTAGQNAADRAIHERRITAQDAKDKQTRIHNFQKNQGDEIPLVINGKTYVIGSNAIDKNVGNIVANIMDDLRDSPKFKDKTDKQLSRDTEWLQANMALNTSRNDVKKLAETMKLYAKDSPSAMKTIQQLSDYYDREKKAAEIGESDYLEDFGFVPAGSKNVNVDDLFD